MRLKTVPALAAISGWLFAQQAAPPPTERDLSILRTGSPSELRTTVQVPRGYAVVIGISQYKNLPAKSNLAFPEKDAESVYSALLNQQAGNFEYDNVLKLTGPKATLANIRAALEDWLPAKAQPSDRVVVFFVGHGVVDASGRGYLAPYDVDVSRLSESAYPMDVLGQVLSNRVKARWKVLLTDACHSGQIAVNSTYERVNDSLRGLPQGFLTLSSSRSSESSYEDPALSGGNGVFSYFLVRGWLGEADTDPADGEVTADELVTYVKREVRAYTKRAGRQQTPIEFGDFPDDLILGFSPERRQKMAAQLPEVENGNLVIEANLDAVEISIDDRHYGTAGPGSPLRVPGLASGSHKIKGSRLGYEPVTVEINLVPAETQTVSLRLLRQRVVKPAAKLLYDQAEEIWTRSNAAPQDLARAADRYARALKEDGSFSAAALGLCRVMNAQGKSDDALKPCAQAVQIDSDYVEAREAYGTALMSAGDYAEAVRQLQQAAIQDPKSTFAHSLLADALYLADRAKEAEEEADKAIQLDGSSAQAYLVRAEAKREQERFDDAAKDYYRSLQLQEFGSGRLRVVAFWLLGTGMQKHRSGRRAIYRSESAQAYFGLCACELAIENYPRALKDCHRVLSVEPGDTESHLLLAQTYAELFNEANRRDYLVQARDNIEATLRLNPYIDTAAQLRGKLKEIDNLLAHIR